MSPSPQTPSEDASPLARLSTEMVRLYKEQFGRGPTKVRSHWAGPDAVVCMLWSTFTPAERNLARMGEHQRLRDVRLFFQHATERDFRAVAERVLGRPVAGYVSGIDTDEDVAVELFLLAPAGGASEA